MTFIHTTLSLAATTNGSAMTTSNTRVSSHVLRAATEPTEPVRHPGDQAPRGTPGTGENVCRRCGGSGRIDGGECPECGGTGRVVEGIGGA
jgi:DnaJ-class molecular chaperone